MSSPMLQATLQSVVMSALSNMLAQAIQVYKQRSFSVVDFTAFVHFILISALMTPPNYAFQRFLEDSFPTAAQIVTESEKAKEKQLEEEKLREEGTEDKVVSESGEEEKAAKPRPRKLNTKLTEQTPTKLSISNVAIKFFLDQSLGASANTVLFIAFMGMFKGFVIQDVLSNVEKDFWTMLSAGWKMWPAVCLLNLVIVPFQYRVLVGNLAGFVWGVLVSLGSF